MKIEDYQFVVFSDSGGDLHYVNDITDKKQLKKALEVIKYHKEINGIDVWIEVRFNPILEEKWILLNL